MLAALCPIAMWVAVACAALRLVDRDVRPGPDTVSLILAAVLGGRCGSSIRDSSIRFWGERWHLLTHPGALIRADVDQRAARKWRVVYAYTDSRHFPSTTPPVFTARDLESSPAYQLVWCRDTVRIFKMVRPPGRGVTASLAERPTSLTRCRTYRPSGVGLGEG